MTSSSSAPASSSQSWSHDVFLSFRGKDTRGIFVDHLYSALILQGFDTYKDDETLPRGEWIRRSLLKAIEESQIAVVVFSKNFADSSWCLDELVHILKCVDTKGQIVMPVFYHVDPSEVGDKKQHNRKAFLKPKNKNKVESWKNALGVAGGISGWEPKNTAGHESKLIKEIVDAISSRLQLVTASANVKLTGIAARVQRLKSELQVGSGGVRMIGIWGDAGGGKTTLASSTYDEICRKFDGCCFIADIREESSRRGLKELEKEILSQMGANNVGRGRCLIGKRLRNRKVLIVLDDVDQLDQLEALAGSPDWFGEGSRIIITTTNEHLLKAHEVVVHKISLLEDDEAIELFRKHAPQGSLPMEEYNQLSKEVVSYAGGLPLALTVLGSSLCDKNIHQWRSALARLKEIPEDKILEKLKVSFDGLTKIQKDLFLDIACFFRQWEKERAIEMLDACGFHPVIGVEELRQRALITFSRGRLDMHDLIQDMGHHIVRGEHPKNPEKHSRVWKEEDVRAICAMDARMVKELDKIEAIQAHVHSFTQYEGPPYLGLAKFYKLKAKREYLPPIVAKMGNLRYLQWRGDPANPLLNNFPPMELRCLILRGGIQEQLWNGSKVLPNLKKMELWLLDDLIMTPNFDGLPNLERFKLYRCPKLKEVHSSFGRLDRLVCLSIEECTGIELFPSITRLKKLENLSFKRSPGLFKLSDIQQRLGSLGHREFSSAVRELSNLNHIQLCFFRRDLRKLDLGSCRLGDEDIGSAVWELPNLQELDLSCNKFSRLNFSLMRIPQLKLLDVSFCTNLVELSELPSSIAVLEADHCTSLETIGDISNCKWLWKVALEMADKVGPHDGYILLKSMLKENAIEDHCINVALPHQIPKGYLGRLFRGDTCTLRLLPCDSYSDFCGILIHVITSAALPEIDIIIKQEEDEDSRFELRQEFDEEPEPDNDPRTTFVGYVSFNSLRRRTTCFNSTHNVISISLRESLEYEAGNRIGAQLVSRKSKDDPVQTTKAAPDYSELWGHEEAGIGSKFKIQHDSNSSIKILWQPNY